MTSDKRLVIVEWTDANCNSSWQDVGTILLPSKCFTAGWLQHEEDGFVMIAGSLTETGEFNQTMTIPRGMITSMHDAQ